MQISGLTTKIASLCICLAALGGCAENPALSYGQAITAQQCHDMYTAELTRWQVEQTVQKPADQKVAAFFEAFSNGLGLYQGEELFQRRRHVCLERVGKQGASLLPQPGSGGQARVFACQRGGGVLQGGSAICPGH